MEYKILAIGDMHNKLSTIFQTRRAKEKILKLIYDLRPNGVVLLGDLHDTHERMNVYAWMEETDLIQQLDSSVDRMDGSWFKYVMGNHDIPSNNLFLERIHPFRSLSGKAIVDTPDVINTPVGQFAFVPYVPNGRFQEALDQARVFGEPNGAKPPYRAIFCHQEFKNADFGDSIISKSGDEWPVDRELVISGHIHKYQEMNGNIIYVGSPYQTTFAEEDEKTVSLFTFTKTDYSQERIGLGMPQKKTYTLTIEELSTVEISKDDDNRLIIMDSSVAIGAFKKSNKFKELQKSAKVVFKPTDKVFVKRDVVKRTFLDIMREYVAKEDPSVAAVFAEVVSASNS